MTVRSDHGQNERTGSDAVDVSLKGLTQTLFWKVFERRGPSGQRESQCTSMKMKEGTDLLLQPLAISLGLLS